MVNDTATKNLCGKTRKVNDPYETWQAPESGWEWRVLKKYKAPASEHCESAKPWRRGSDERSTVGCCDR